MDLFLLHGKTSTCSSKVRLVLAETGLAWDGKILDLGRGESRHPDYLKLNPNGVVPTMLVDGVPLIESSLIIQYLDEISSGRRLTPGDPFARAQMRLWLKRIDDELHPAISTLTYATTMRAAWLKRSPEDQVAALNGVADPDARRRREELLRAGFASPYCAGAGAAIGRIIADLSSVLDQHAFVVGEQRSLADLALLPYLHRLELFGLASVFMSSAALGQWHEQETSRAAFQVAVLDWMDPADFTKYGGFARELEALFV